jgi:predicted site-specific integrase-resolvase
MSNGEPRNYLTVQQARKVFNVSAQTLRIWETKGYITSVSNPSNTRLYDCSCINDFRKPDKEIFIKKKTIMYARVSTAKQKQDLERQKAFLTERFPKFSIISDVGSGLNYKRKGFKKIIEYILNDELECLVVTSKDRLCRFGFELIEFLCQKRNVKLLVLEQADKTPEQEFTEDILAILQVFACRWNGKRSYSVKTKDPITNQENSIALEFQGETVFD